MSCSILKKKKVAGFGKERQMQGFRDALSYGDLHDLGFFGPTFTWNNNVTKSLLDREVANASWFDQFGHSRVLNLPPN